MGIHFKTDETFRDDFSYRNSDAAVLRFPFPFGEDTYRYSVNIEPHVKAGPSPAFEHAFDVDEHYVAECRERAIVLDHESETVSGAAAHDARAMGHARTSDGEPVHGLPRAFQPDAGRDRMALDQPSPEPRPTLRLGDASTLPCEPFEYITRQAQGDFTLQDQRDNNLYVDGGMVTTQADWSLEFDIGMSFHEWHGPVPLAHEIGVFDRALQYLLRLQYGHPVRRLNWTMTINPRLDTSPENYPDWGPDRTTLTAENIAGKLHLRVELQTLFRLPRSNAILFGIRCYLISLQDIERVKKWHKRLHRVLATLPPELVEYKGLIRFYDLLVSRLAAMDDGTPLSLGIQPDQTQLPA